MKKEQYVVSLVRPPGVTRAEMREYIADAVGAWKGQLHPEDPLFRLDRSKVSARAIPTGQSLADTLKPVRVRPAPKSEMNEAVKAELCATLEKYGFRARGSRLTRGLLLVELGSLAMKVAVKLQPPEVVRVGPRKYLKTHRPCGTYYYKHFRNGTFTAEDVVGAFDTWLGNQPGSA